MGHRLASTPGADLRVALVRPAQQLGTTCRLGLHLMRLKDGLQLSPRLGAPKVVERNERNGNFLPT